MNTDVLSLLLTRFSARARLFYSGHLCGDVRCDASVDAGFLHLVRAGSARLRDDTGVDLWIREPTLMFYARPLSHSILADARTGVDLACASVDFDNRAFNPIALALPARVLCPLSELEKSASLLDMLFAEAFDERPGRQEVVNRLFELVLIQLLRRRLAQGCLCVGSLRGLAHPRLRKPLTAMHVEPARAWTLDALAQLAAMSRSNFFEVFRRETGQTPGNYLTRWRIMVAQALLRDGTPSKLIAGQVGYRSRAGFHRAFKQVVGRSPKDWSAGHTTHSKQARLLQTIAAAAISNP